MYVFKRTILKNSGGNHLLHAPLLVAAAYNVDQGGLMRSGVVLDFGQPGQCVNRKEGFVQVPACEWVGALDVPIDGVDNMREESWVVTGDDVGEDGLDGVLGGVGAGGMADCR